MQDLLYNLQEGTLNGICDKIYNCRVVKPTYEKDGIYSTNFMLDKRLGTKKIDALYKVGYTFCDVASIKGHKYYLAFKDNKFHIFYEDGTLLNATGVNQDTDSPLTFIKGKGAGGTLVTSGALTEVPTELDSVGIVGLYDSGYIRVKVPGCTVGQFLVFTSGLLKGATNRVEYVDGDYIYIIGTNNRGTLPYTGDTYRVYSSKSETLLVGGTSGLFLFNLNLGGTNDSPINILPEKIIDHTRFNGQILALTETGVYYSNSNLDGNCNIYPRDLVKGYGRTGLINIKTSVLAIGDSPELIKDMISTSGSIGYVSHELELTSEFLGKNSYIFKDGIFMMITKDKRIPTVNIKNINNTLSETNLNYTDSVFRGLFSEISDTVMCNNDGVFSHVISHSGNETTIYELDFEYKHWIIQTYDFLIYKKFDGEILGTDGVYSIEGYDDLGTEYAQELNLSSGTGIDVVQPYNNIITLFGLFGEAFDLTLDMEIELGGQLQKRTFNITNLYIDEVIDIDPTLDDLIGYEVGEIYDGTIMSIKRTIGFSGRYARFKYHGLNRFIIGPSKVFFEVPSNKLINELDGTE